jgi:hypothetical protein
VWRVIGFSMVAVLVVVALVTYPMRQPRGTRAALDGRADVTLVDIFALPQDQRPRITPGQWNYAIGHVLGMTAGKRYGAERMDSGSARQRFAAARGQGRGPTTVRYVPVSEATRRSLAKDAYRSFGDVRSDLHGRGFDVAVEAPQEPQFTDGFLRGYEEGAAEKAAQSPGGGAATSRSSQAR